MSNRQRTEI